MPLSKPALATLAIFTFMGSWNSFEWPLIVTNDLRMRTLPVGLSIFQGRYNLEYGLTMASAVIITVPMLIAFLVFQRRITEGIALTGLK
jgi:multiple sugar transport system permease protein